MDLPQELQGGILNDDVEEGAAALRR
jgi:hypothetical protein